MFCNSAYSCAKPSFVCHPGRSFFILPKILFGILLLKFIFHLAGPLLLLMALGHLVASLVASIHHHVHQQQPHHHHHHDEQHRRSRCGRRQFSPPCSGTAQAAPANTSTNATRSSVISNMTIERSEEKVVLSMDIPGVAMENLKVEVKDGKYLVVEGKRGDLEFGRRFCLSEEILMDKISANLSNGVLMVTAQKKEKPAPIVIAVSQGPPTTAPNRTEKPAGGVPSSETTNAATVETVQEEEEEEEEEVEFVDVPQTKSTA